MTLKKLSFRKHTNATSVYHVKARLAAAAIKRALCDQFAKNPGALPFCHCFCDTPLPNQTLFLFVFQSTSVFFESTLVLFVPCYGCHVCSAAARPRAWRAHVEVLRLCATEGEVHYVPFNTPADDDPRF